ncbi:MAG: hypothetical protein IIC79_06475, partial [Chloroflexi bacterium]|nr:hypothetical protein [Chloroflexota bacterium]
DTDLLPDSAVVAFVTDKDYIFGLLHSTLHEFWARRMGRQLREAESGSRYTPTSTFETFPFPWPPGQEPSEDEDERVKNIAEAARQLVNFRQAWLFPPEEEIGVTIGVKELKQRTLTNMYNALEYYRENVKGKQRNQTEWKQAVKRRISMEEIETLDHIHDSLDKAVLDAYGWPHGLSDEQILARLLALNLERAAGEEKQG